MPAIENTFTHFDFTKPGRRVLLIGPMGSGKTEFAARVWRDAAVAQTKSGKVKELTSTNGVDRRNIFFIRSEIDGARFTDYPEDALAYRSGYIRCGDNIARIRDSFGLEDVIRDNPSVGTYIIDEASFFDERLAYVVRNAAIEKGCMFIFPTLVLNFRKDLFNNTARLMLETATDVIPLTAYCEHSDCMDPAFYTYRYYSVVLRFSLILSLSLEVTERRKAVQSQTMPPVAINIIICRARNTLSSLLSLSEKLQAAEMPSIL